MDPNFDRTFAIGFIYLGILARYDFKLTNRNILRQDIDTELTKHHYDPLTDIEIERCMSVARLMDMTK